jgi:hypothetical protein
MSLPLRLDLVRVMTISDATAGAVVVTRICNGATFVSVTDTADIHEQSL